jgi:hypothetical protein
MLSFGSAAYTRGKELIGTFSANLETLPDATADPKTAEWWAQQPEAWTACRQELEMPESAMRRYVIWLKALPGKPVFVGYPAGFDFLFVYWYLIRFAGESPFSFSALDIKTYAMALLKKDYRKCTKGGMPIPTWPSTTPSNRVRCSAICLLRILATRNFALSRGKNLRPVCLGRRHAGLQGLV